ncbi:MAG TPA: NAD(P)H-dependent oxidoreductase [Steroidobacteraceae bacterium]|nr:NAD(P)H-dependent oxidoreductase [Steroidobacteraceae bacterium]
MSPDRRSDPDTVPWRPLVVGVGGTTRGGSSSEKALRLVLAEAQLAGADVQLFTGREIELPMYAPESKDRSREAMALISALRRANGIVLASPGYHGSVSGLLKNALDYVEDMRSDDLPYFEGRAVGLIACAAGWQATGSTLSALRSIVHALRGWPTPLGVAINTIGRPFNEDGTLAEPGNTAQMKILAQQVVHFAQMRALRDLGRHEAAASATI